MKRVFTWASLAVFMLAFAGFVNGDDAKKDAPAKGKGQLPPNWAKLGLSDDQKQKVYAVQSEFGPQIIKLQKEIQDLRKKQSDELAKILTDAQKTRLKEILSEKVPGATDAKKPSPTANPNKNPN
jgi:hypothetical protein